MANTRQVHTASLLPDGKVLVAGDYNNGAQTSATELYNPWTGRSSHITFQSLPTVDEVLLFKRIDANENLQSTEESI